MEKFSKLRQKSEMYHRKDDVLYKKGDMDVIEYEDWTVVRTSDYIICVPILIESNQIVLRYEYIPTFKYVDGQEYFATLVAGRIESGETPIKALFRELEEEAGIVLNDEYRPEELKPLFTSKGLTSKAYPFILPLNERDYYEVIAKGDGSKSEAMSKSVKVDIKHIDSVNPSDLVTAYMLEKVKEYLNIKY
jgi:8-oxo-dGTP pyrophosphatase MutT (NUDIX family)